MYQLIVFKHKVFMSILKLAMKVISTPRPDMFVGPDSSLLLCDFIASKGYKNVMLVSDKGLSQLNLYSQCQARLEKSGIKVNVFDEIAANPSCHQIEDGIRSARATKADAVLAFGGGSSMDAAKIIAAGVKNNKPVTDMVGLFKIRHKPVPIYAIPTTAGTGAEATPAAVITVPEEQKKCSIGDFKLVPKAAALDANLMLGLPPGITAATGMDVLTHAIEAYLSTFSNDEVDERCRYAVKAVFQNLPEAYNNGNNTDARTAMALASYQAGIAISDAGVGYVHAIAHKMGGKYGTPHGFANAVILPHVLKFSKDAIDERLCELAELIGEPRSADAFILAIENLNESLDIPRTFAELVESDIEEIFEVAQNEAMALFPVPKYMTRSEGENLVRGLLA